MEYYLPCFKVRNTATGAWKENTATATTASARMGLGCKAKATVEAVVEVDTIEDCSQSKIFSRSRNNFSFGNVKLLIFVFRVVLFMFVK